MRLLAEIERNLGINKEGKRIARQAVRAIVLDGKQLLMLYSTKIGDYKFPGGGIDPGESHGEALARELREECGAKLIALHGDFGKVVEYATSRETDYDVFCMTSYYYFCEIDTHLTNQSLEDYEVGLGLEPQWVEVGKALATNKKVLANGAPPWTEREAVVLNDLEKVLNKRRAREKD